MNLSAPLKALALVVFLAALAGATYGVQQVLGNNVEGQLLRAEPARETLNATAGNTVTYAVGVHNRGDEARAVSLALAGDGLEGSAQAREVAADATVTFFVPVRVPDGLAPGDYPLDLRVLDAEGQTLRERAGAATLRVLAPGGEGYQPGQDASFVYTGRLDGGGQVFTTTDPALRPQTLDRAREFSASAFEAPEGLLEAMQGMQEGESRTLSLPGERAYSNVSIQRIPREDVILRRESVPLPSVSLPMDEFAAYVQQTRQGNAADFKVGDTIEAQQAGQTLQYRVVKIGPEGVELRLVVTEGARFSLYPFWPQASVVTGFNETHATFETTPTTNLTEPFTARNGWPQMSSIVREDEERVVVRHDPPVGLRYQGPQVGFAPGATYTVTSVDEQEIVVTSPTGNPLANQPVTFDVLLLSLA